MDVRDLLTAAVAEAEKTCRHGYGELGPGTADACAPCITDATLPLIRRVLDALADCVVKAAEHGEQEGGFVAFYLSPTGPIHRAIPLLEQYGINVRPGFDGRESAA